MMISKKIPGQTKDGSFFARLFKSPWPWGLFFLYSLLLIIDGHNVQIFCDESSILKNVLGFAVKRTIEPLFINYPTFFSYLTAIPIYIGYLIYFIFVRHFPLEGLADVRLFALVFQGDLNIWLWFGRMVSIFCAAGILVLVYRYCITRFNRSIAVCSAFLLICSPYSFYMTYARYSLPDMFVALLVTGILFLASKYVDQPNKRYLYLASFLVGLAASAKLNGVVSMAPLLALPWILPNTILMRVRLMSIIALWAMLGFFVGSPYNVLKPQLYASGFGLESTLLYGSSNSFNYQWLLPAFWREDPIMTALSISVIVFSLWRHTEKDMVYHALLIPTVIVLGGLSKHMLHYMLFLFPWTCIMSGEFLYVLFNKKGHGILRWVVIAGLIGLVAYNSHLLTARLIHNSRENNLIIARDWMKNNISVKDHILLDSDVVPRVGYIDLNVLSPYEYLNKNKYPPIVREYLSHEINFYFSYLNTYSYSVKDLKAQGWKYFITSNACFTGYLQDPSKVDAVESEVKVAFEYYLQRRSFYLRLWKDSLSVTMFKNGSGPEIYIFRLM